MVGRIFLGHPQVMTGTKMLSITDTFPLFPYFSSFYPFNFPLSHTLGFGNSPFARPLHEKHLFKLNTFFLTSVYSF